MRLIVRLALFITIFAFSFQIAFAEDNNPNKQQQVQYPRASQKTVDAEKKLGDEGAASAEKELKFVKDEQLLKRVETIGQRLSAVAEVHFVAATYGVPDLADFDYSFKIVDDKDMNAFALPGGRIYVNKCLLDRIESDDELAGVLAHEIAHVAHHHMLYLLKKQGQYDKLVLAIIAAAMISKTETNDMKNIFFGAKLLEMAKLNAYTQEAEDDADRTAIEYMIKAKYNPVGILTFMEKLAREQTEPADLGVLRTHPETRLRAINIMTNLQQRGIRINRRSVALCATAVVRDVTVKGKQLSEVAIGSKTVYQPVDVAGVTSSARAKALADEINNMLDQNPQMRDVRLGGDGVSVYIKQTLVLVVKEEDAVFAGESREQLAINAKEAIQAALLSDSFGQVY